MKLFDIIQIEIILNYNNQIIIVEKSNKFIKKSSINADELNLSINIMNCNFNNIDKKYFKVFNFEEININLDKINCDDELFYSKV